jgi:hypothetical protein
MRKEKDYNATHGRDINKRFKITEMPAMKAEKWAARFFLALAKSGIDIPPDIVSQGMAGVAIVALRTLGGVEFTAAEPLMDEMFQCVSIYLPNNDMMTRPPTGQDDIEEVQTIYELRKEVIELHLGFSIAEWLSKLSNKKTSSTDSSDTSTSQTS